MSRASKVLAGLAGVGLAVTAAFVLLNIWIGDDRWGDTAFVTFCLSGGCCVMAAVINVAGGDA